MAFPVRVLAVDHNRILLEGISVLISMHPDLELVGAVGAAGAAVALFSEKRPDLTLMDLDLPAGEGLEAISRIQSIDPSAWVVALATDERDVCCRQAVLAGASAVLVKDSVGKLLVPLIRRGRTTQSDPMLWPSTAGRS